MNGGSLSVLRIESSARGDESVSRALTAAVIDALAAAGPVTVTVRDLGAAPVPVIGPDWVAANATDPSARTPDQRAALAISDALVAEMRAADVIVIGLPVYNFGPPSVLKAWIDQVARARETFRYTADGPEGLLKGKRAILAMASGGTAVGSPIDFATPYLRHVLGFLGITDVAVVAADRHTRSKDRIDAARAAAAALARPDTTDVTVALAV